MRAISGARLGIRAGGGSGRGGEPAAGSRGPGGVVTVRALVLGGARSGKSAFAERLTFALGGARVLYVATALVGEDAELERRVRLHRERRPLGWGTLEIGGLDEVLEAAEGWDAVLLDSLTLWVSARQDDEGRTLRAFERFLEGAEALPQPLVLVSDEVGLGVVPESEAGRRFRDALGLVNQRAAAAAAEVYFCAAGVGVRIK